MIPFFLTLSIKASYSSSTQLHDFHHATVDLKYFYYLKNLSVPLLVHNLLAMLEYDFLINSQELATAL